MPNLLHFILCFVIVSLLLLFVAVFALFRGFVLFVCCRFDLPGGFFSAEFMSKVIKYNGDDLFYPGGSLYSNPNDPSCFLSIGNHVDVYFPLFKKSRVSTPYIISAKRYEQKKQVSIEVLPDECLFEIFRRLPPKGQEKSNCALVSKRWLTLLSDISGYELKETVKVGNGDESIESDACLSRCLKGKKATDIRLAAIAVGTSTGAGLGRLSIRGTNSIRGVTDKGMRAIARGCPSLKSLSIWNVTSIGDEGMIEIANGCQLLEKLDLCQCPTITDKSLIAIAKRCPTLTDLTIESCSNIGNATLQAIAQFCVNLKSISLKNCPLIGDQGITSLCSSASHALTRVKLKRLNVTDMALAVIGHYGKVVKYLVLTGLRNVSEKGLWVMANGQGLKMLKSITITSCNGVTDVSLEALGKGCPSLKQFILHKNAALSDNGLVSFVITARSLENLQLEECHRISQAGLFGSLINCEAKLKAVSVVHCLGFKDFNMEFPNIISSSCNSLQSLLIRNCPGFGNASLATLAKLCPRLQHLELSGLTRVTDAGVIPLLESFDAGLVNVNLSNCVHLTDRSVSTLAKLHCWTLEVLNVEGCGKITDASLSSIAENCFMLIDLDVSKCVITDYGIASLASANQLNLQILSIMGCALISETSLPFIEKLGHTLIGLNLQHCNGISSSKVSLLEEHIWRCDILS